MKIIGIGPREGRDETLIAQLTVDEAANLCGYFSAYHVPDRRRGFKPGDVINVAEIFSRLNAIRAHEEQVGAIRQKLERIAAELKPIEPLLRLAQTPEQPTDQQTTE